MKLAKTLKNTDLKSWRKLASAFYDLAHNDYGLWNNLTEDLKQTDVGLICKEYIKTKDPKLIEQAGCLLAGQHWYIALGR